MLSTRPTQAATGILQTVPGLASGTDQGAPRSRGPRRAGRREASHTRESHLWRGRAGYTCAERRPFIKRSIVVNDNNSSINRTLIIHATNSTPAGGCQPQEVSRSSSGPHTIRTHQVLRHQRPSLYIGDGVHAPPYPTRGNALQRTQRQPH